MLFLLVSWLCVVSHNTQSGYQQSCFNGLLIWGTWKKNSILRKGGWSSLWPSFSLFAITVCLWVFSSWWFSMILRLCTHKQNKEMKKLLQNLPISLSLSLSLSLSYLQSHALNPCSLSTWHTLTLASLLGRNLEDRQTPQLLMLMMTCAFLSQINTKNCTKIFTLTSNARERERET